jgi:hypothetical protein
MELQMAQQEAEKKTKVIDLKWVAIGSLVPVVIGYWLIRSE